MGLKKKYALIGGLIGLFVAYEKREELEAGLDWLRSKTK